MKNSKRYIFSVLILLSYVGTASAQKIGQQLPEKTRILFLLDGSGSMLASWGEVNRITAAKDLLSNLVDSLKTNQDVQLALRVYGHRYPRQSRNCRDTKLEVPFAQNNHRQLINRLQEIEPKGTTPIAYSLEQAASDFPVSSDYRNIIIIITDGIESCDGDPCAVSLALQRKNIFLKPFIIGIGMDGRFKKEFSCMGEFYDAKDSQSFKKAINKALVTSLEKTTVSVELLDAQKKPTITNVNVSFTNGFTKQAVSDFVHYRDAIGRPDSVELDPVINYDVIVNTIPPVRKRNVRLAPGTHNTISIEAPQGNLQLKQKSSSSYPNGVVALIKQKNRLVHVQPMNSIQNYLTGTYDIELLTTPRLLFRGIEIKPKITELIDIPAPGLVNINHNASGYGSIYTVSKDGEQKWVYDLDHNQKRITVALQSGKYKIVFRAEKAPGSKYTAIKTINVIEGRSISVNVFN